METKEQYFGLRQLHLTYFNLSSSIPNELIKISPRVSLSPIRIHYVPRAATAGGHAAAAAQEEAAGPAERQQQRLVGAGADAGGGDAQRGRWPTRQVECGADRGGLGQHEHAADVWAAHPAPPLSHLAARGRVHGDAPASRCVDLCEWAPHHAAHDPTCELRVFVYELMLVGWLNNNAGRSVSE